MNLKTIEQRMMADLYQRCANVAAQEPEVQEAIIKRLLFGGPVEFNKEKSEKLAEKLAPIYDKWCEDWSVKRKKNEIETKQ